MAANLRLRSGSPLGGAAVLALPVEHVVSRQRHRVDGFGNLHLENHVILPPESDFRSDEVHLPHPAEALVINCTHAVAISLELPPPRSERLGVMQAQNFDIGDPEPQLLDYRQDLGKRRHVTAGGDVLAYPGAGRAWTVPATDRVDQRHAV